MRGLYPNVADPNVPDVAALHLFFHVAPKYNLRPSLRRLGTDLSPSQSVRAAEAVPPLRNGQGPADLTPRSVAIDPQNQDVIRRARDEEERRKRQKASDEALSRMRAYRQPAADAGPAPDHPHADIEI